MLNLVGKSFKNAYAEEYAVRKVVESFYNMEIREERMMSDGTHITFEEYNEMLSEGYNGTHFN